MAQAQISKILNARVIIENYNVWEKIIEILAINESWSALKSIIESVVKAIEELDYKDENILSIVKKTMQLYLYSTINRALALVWGTEVEELIDDLRRQYVGLEDYRRFYCKTRMLDKSVMPIFIDMLQIDKIFKTEKTLNLSNFQQMVLFCKDKYSSVSLQVTRQYVPKVLETKAYSVIIV